ncbi:cytochrome b-c1 complex subunit 9 [Plakobranchus ocellatus]|uniref:Cytochrome b-c1 complex subunit 9 n=1 Tax=Plakobranchus ocellatus TaxID=259542 RepID=A0AAV4A3A7_9GAST|nr:cytochrome b-c1 complex subunit 9 [Plakobranchus ocellatus]
MDPTSHRMATQERQKIKRKTSKVMARRHCEDEGKYVEQRRERPRRMETRTSTFVVAVVVLAYPFERAFNVGTERYFRFINKGKFYDDIKGQFGEDAGEEE